MLNTTKVHIEAKKFDGYKARIAKISDAQRETNASHIDSILARINPVD
jgi:hypothetical protein